LLIEADILFHRALYMKNLIDMRKSHIIARRKHWKLTIGVAQQRLAIAIQRPRRGQSL
jgi:hypothetical protein